MAKKVTLADIAAVVGVSNVAVYKALSDKPGVREELRKQIKEVAQQMGYKSSSSSEKKNSVQRTGNIGVVVPERYYGISASFYGQMYEKVVRALFRCNYYGILEILTYADEQNENMPRVFDERRVDGVIFLGPIEERYSAEMVNRAKLPVYFMDTYHSALTFDTVISDGFHGTYMLTNYLIREGHRKIAFVGSVDATSSIADRYWGYRRALRERGIEYQEEWEIPDRDENGVTLDVILKDQVNADAYVCNCDFAAYYVIQELEKMGYCVPEDISVVGFDNFLPMGIGMEQVQITSYEVDMERMADICVKSLIRKIEGKKYMEGVQLVPGKIVYKKTVAPKK